MATGFPTSLDALTNPTSTSALTSPSHADQHADANDAIEALQAKVGVNGSAVTTSLDYRVGLFSGRNAIINGAMNVWQRGTSTSLALGGGGYVGPDRWWYYNNGFTSTISRQSCGSTLPQFQYCARIQRTSGQTGTVAMVLFSPQETINSLRFAGKNATVSFYARASSGASRANTMDMSIVTGTGTDQSNFGGGAYTGSSQIAYINPTLTTSWQRFSVTGAVASTATEIGLQLGFIPTGTAGALDYFEITGIQLEEGAVATPFEFEDFGDTLRKCMRYYQKSFRQDIAPATATNNFDGSLQWQGNGGGFGAWCHRSLPVIMRSAPLVTLFNPVSANSQARNTASGVDIQSCTATGYTSAITTVASGTNDAASQGSAIHYTLSSEL